MWLQHLVLYPYNANLKTVFVVQTRATLSYAVI